MSPRERDASAVRSFRACDSDMPALVAKSDVAILP